MDINFFCLAEMSKSQRDVLNQRGCVDFRQLKTVVEPILQAVKERGDEAVSEFTRTFDGANLEPAGFRVSPEAIEDSIKGLPNGLRAAMETAVTNIRRFHEQQVETHWEIEVSPGIIAGERVIPIDSVGLYVPRGKGSFPSMMMMAAVPARVAGVPRVVVVTPPDRDGKPDPATIAAAGLIGFDEIYAVGGVQAIGALAYGTQTIPRVDKIVGPGSGYVLAAKQLLSTIVDTGLPAGPSEAIVLADHTTDPFMAAHDLLIEAEHGPDSAAYLVTTDSVLAKRALEIIPELIERLPQERASYCRTVLSTNGGIVLARDLEDAVRFINEYAPEHLQVLTNDPDSVLPMIRSAGEVLLGPYTPGTLANYSIGPNAILPTSGFARTASALSVRDFTRRMSYSKVSEEAFKPLAEHTLVLADYEGFAAHAAALRFRLTEDKRKNGKP